MMKANKWMKVGLVACGILMLTACSHKRAGQTDINAANAAYGNGAADASGLGNESEFGDQAGGGRRGLSNRVYYFDYDSTSVRSDDRAAILANAKYIMSHSNAQVMLEGHTDPRGSREYNIGLGERRAKAVAAILTAQGVNPAQIRVVSYGAEKLASPGRTESDYQLDRRVVLVYIKR
jgi:peptidoglycan-associated lipoprotein